MFKSTVFHVRDGALIGDLRDAMSPLVWRMELSRVHAAGFRIVPDGTHWDLVIESGKGEAQTIASFATHALAQRALRRLSRALQRQEWGRFATRLAIIVVVLTGLYFVLNFMAGLSSYSRALKGSPGAAVVAAPQGQSLSADKVLSAPPR